MKWTLDQLNEKMNAFGEAHRFVENENREQLRVKYQEGADAILKEAGWTHWDWMCETEPGCMGAGPYIRRALSKLPDSKKLAKGLEQLASYQEALVIQTLGNDILVQCDFYEKINSSDLQQLAIFGFSYTEIDKRHFWIKKDILNQYR